MVLALVADMHLRACALCVPGASVRFPAVCVLYSSKKRLKFPPAPSVPYGASVHLPFTSHMSVSASSLLYRFKAVRFTYFIACPGRVCRTESLSHRRLTESGSSRRHRVK